MKDIKLMINQGVGDEFMPIFSIDDDMMDENEVFDETLPLLALKNTVLFPGIVIPITIGREKSVKAVKAADKDITPACGCCMFRVYQ